MSEPDIEKAIAKKHDDFFVANLTGDVAAKGKLADELAALYKGASEQRAANAIKHLQSAKTDESMKPDKTNDTARH